MDQPNKFGQHTAPHTDTYSILILNIFTDKKNQPKTCFFIILVVTYNGKIPFSVLGSICKGCLNSPESVKLSKTQPWHFFSVSLYLKVRHLRS